MPGRGRTYREGGLPDSIITTSELKDSTVRGVDLSFFKSPPVPMTGAPVPIPHGLGRVPAKVTVTIVDGPVVYVPPMIVELVHTATDVVVSGSVGWFVVVEAT